MFTTSRLLLRSFDVDADAIQMLQWLNNEDFSWAVNSEPPRGSTREQAKKFLETMASNKDGLPCFAVCLKPTESERRLHSNEDYFLTGEGEARYPMIGTLTIYARPRFSIVNRIVRFGVAFDEEYQGRGFGTELLEWALGYIFDSLNLHKCELSVSEDNHRAIRLYERLGFVHEGRSRQAFFRDRKWHDQLSMGILESEWLERHSISH